MVCLLQGIKQDMVWKKRKLKPNTIKQIWSSKFQTNFARLLIWICVLSHMCACAEKVEVPTLMIVLQAAPGAFIMLRVSSDWRQRSSIVQNVKHCA